MNYDSDIDYSKLVSKENNIYKIIAKQRERIKALEKMNKMNKEDLTIDEWVTIYNVLDKYMLCYNVIKGNKEDFVRDKEAIDKLKRTHSIRWE